MKHFTAVVTPNERVQIVRPVVARVVFFLAMWFPRSLSPQLTFFILFVTPPTTPKVHKYLPLLSTLLPAAASAHCLSILQRPPAGVVFSPPASRKRRGRHQPSRRSPAAPGSRTEASDNARECWSVRLRTTLMIY